jgi:hypothetical protein
MRVLAARAPALSELVVDHGPAKARAGGAEQAEGEQAGKRCPQSESEQETHARPGGGWPRLGSAEAGGRTRRAELRDCDAQPDAVAWDGRGDILDSPGASITTTRGIAIRLRNPALLAPSAGRRGSGETVHRDTDAELRQRLWPSPSRSHQPSSGFIPGHWPTRSVSALDSRSACSVTAACGGPFRALCSQGATRGRSAASRTSHQRTPLCPRSARARKPAAFSSDVLLEAEGA